ncbi:xylulokinase [Actinopolymorpha singaporensis]|uniref:Xylulokinase n=1 Tax=Actinopolymorpha singaporensis TaxID=117157 RepID=A0A1H1YG09_9ACTN|nr:FGGY family carbohydrate kinase [Actinopolymorpha singaporensis]SDT20367.1 xylulokinase [Actinopolymorpha singaporensis]
MAGVTGVSNVVVGVDVGTTGVKAVVADAGGRVLAEAGEEYPTRYVPPHGAEQEPDDWWSATARCVAGALRSAAETSGLSPAAVECVGVSSQAPSVVVLDRSGVPVGPALLWLDRRGQAECRARAESAADVVAATGNRMDAYFAAPKLAWLLAERPEVRRAGAAVVMANGYVVHRLTGVPTCDTGHQGLTLLADLDTGRWSDALVDLWGIPRAWLPEAVDPGTVVGRVGAEAGRVTGLLAGTPVVAGAVDGAAAALEAGLARHGDVCEMTGQSTVVNAAVEAGRLRRDALGTMSVLPYPLPGHHLVYGSMVATGGILRWFRDEFGDREVRAAESGSAGSGSAGSGSGSAGSVFAALDALAATAPVGSGGLVLLPYFLGERSPVWNADARGALVGLSMASRRAEVVRAILEGTAYGLAHNLDELARLGLRPAVLRSVGGGARGRTWNQIKADVTGLPVEVPPNTRGAPVGVALVAAAGVGLVADLAQAVAARSRPGEGAGSAVGAAQEGRAADAVRHYSPDPGRHKAYQRYYAVYRELYPALRRSYDLLAEARAADG